MKRAMEHGLCGLTPAVATIALIVFQLHLHAVALDFHVAYWPAAHRLIHGLSPYAVTHKQVVAGTGFVYPALAAVLLAPFGLIPDRAAQIVFMFLCLACVPAILRTLGVRDWRLYGPAMLWFPVLDGWESGNVTLPLVLAVALVWRHRDRPVVAGLLTAVAISVKTFVWPLGLWLLATRRWKAAGWALGLGLLFNLIAWGTVGFNEISAFSRLAAQDTRALWREGYSMLAVAHHLGASRQLGEGLLVLVSAFAAATLVRLGQRRDERAALAVMILLMLLASPLVWVHYFALLLIPLALSRPKLGVVWLLPLLLWPVPPRQPVYGWEEALVWGVAGSCMVVALRALLLPTENVDERGFERAASA